MDNKQKGDITELESIQAFIELGCSVSTPYGCHEKYDFIADIGGELIRVQCKTSKSYHDGDCFIFDSRMKQYSNGKRSFAHYDEGDFDYYATTYEGKCYLVPFNECYSSKVLRLRPSKVLDRVTFNWAKDYELEKTINKLKVRQKDER